MNSSVNIAQQWISKSLPSCKTDSQDCDSRSNPSQRSGLWQKHAIRVKTLQKHVLVTKRFRAFLKHHRGLSLTSTHEEAVTLSEFTASRLKGGSSERVKCFTDKVSAKMSKDMSGITASKIPNAKTPTQAQSAHSSYTSTAPTAQGPKGQGQQTRVTFHTPSCPQTQSLKTKCTASLPSFLPKPPKGQEGLQGVCNFNLTSWEQALFKHAQMLCNATRKRRNSTSFRLR